MPSSTRTRIKELIKQADGNLESSLTALAGVLALFEELERQEAHQLDVIMQGILISKEALEAFNKTI